MNNQIPSKPMMALAVMVLCSQIAPALRAQNSNSAPAIAEAGRMYGAATAAPTSRAAAMVASISASLVQGRAAS